MYREREIERIAFTSKNCDSERERERKLQGGIDRLRGKERERERL